MKVKAYMNKNFLLLGMVCLVVSMACANDTRQLLCKECPNTLDQSQWEKVIRLAGECDRGCAVTKSQVLKFLKIDYVKGAEIAAATLAYAVCYFGDKAAMNLLRKMDMRFFLLYGLARDNENVKNFLAWSIRYIHSYAYRKTEFLLFRDVFLNEKISDKMKSRLPGNPDNAIGEVLQSCFADLMFCYHNNTEFSDTLTELDKRYNIFPKPQPSDVVTIPQVVDVDESDESSSASSDSEDVWGSWIEYTREHTDDVFGDVTIGYETGSNRL